MWVSLCEPVCGSKITRKVNWNSWIRSLIAAGCFCSIVALIKNENEQPRMVLFIFNLSTSCWSTILSIFPSGTYLSAIYITHAIDTDDLCLFACWLHSNGKSYPFENHVLSISKTLLHSYKKQSFKWNLPRNNNNVFFYLQLR